MVGKLHIILTSIIWEYNYDTFIGHYFSSELMHKVYSVIN